MSAGPRLTPFLLKEVRELGPIWLGGILLAAFGPRELGFLVLAGTCLALGVMSIGHEFRRGTVDALLSQPMGRLTILTFKLVVLVPMVASVTVVALMRVARGPSPEWLFVPAAMAICLAPAFTMLARGELGGLVLTAAIPAFLWMAGQMAGVLLYGMSSTRYTEIAALQNDIFETGMLVALGVGAVLGVLLFRRLEATKGLLGTELRFGSKTSNVGMARPAPRRRTAFAALVRKELHLYGLPLAIAILYTLAWIVATKWDTTVFRTVDVASLTRGMVAVYIGAMTILVSSTASAEERQLGTLAAETLLPIENWKRWTIKVGCAAGVVLVLGIVLPIALGALFPTPDPRGVRTGDVLASLWQRGSFFRTFFSGVAGVAGIFAIGLYASSLMTGGLRALLASIATVAAIPSLVAWIAMESGSASQWFTSAIGLDADSWLTRLLVDERFRDRFQLYRWMPLVITAVLLVAVMRYAYQNHRTLERPARAFGRQFVRILTLLIVAISIQAFVAGLTSAAFLARWNERQKARMPAPVQTGSPAQR